uniref:Uncharacterized protein n=1 Tax=Oryza rufipogon TaxID=4529 RepID=A0A0E0NWZ8_ORYRU
MQMAVAASTEALAVAAAATARAPQHHHIPSQPRWVVILYSPLHGMFVKHFAPPAPVTPPPHPQPQQQQATGGRGWIRRREQGREPNEGYDDLGADDEEQQQAAAAGGGPSGEVRSLLPSLLPRSNGEIRRGSSI